MFNSDRVTSIDQLSGQMRRTAIFRRISLFLRLKDQLDETSVGEVVVQSDGNSLLLMLLLFGCSTMGEICVSISDRSDDDQSEKISPRLRLLLPLLGVLIVVLRRMKKSLARQLTLFFVSWSSIVWNGSLMTQTERYSSHSSSTDDRNDAEELVSFVVSRSLRMTLSLFSRVQAMISLNERTQFVSHSRKLAWKEKGLPNKSIRPWTRISFDHVEEQSQSNNNGQQNSLADRIFSPLCPTINRSSESISLKSFFNSSFCSPDDH